MMNNRRMALGLISGILLLFVSNYDAQANPIVARETIVGIVTASDWDEEGNIIEVVISVMLYPQDSTQLTYTEDYLVAPNEKGKELLTLVNEKVEATGNVESDADGYKTIIIENYVKITDDLYQEQSYEDEPLKQR